MKRANSDRKENLEKNLRGIIHALKKHYQPEQVIVFGSFASGHVTPTSDLDILIVKKTTKRFYDRIRDVISICDYNVGVDFLVYTPEELEEESKENLFVKNEILAKGKVVYRAAA